MYVAFAVVLFVLAGESARLTVPNLLSKSQTHVAQVFRNLHNYTSNVAETLLQPNNISLANFTYNLPTNESQSKLMDCLGLGENIAKVLEQHFMSEPNGSYALDVRFFMSTRKQPRRVEVVLGEQFGLQWTDFKIERRTMIIVHGFLSSGGVDWVKNMEKTCLEWNDVNVVVIDWSAGSNTLNYYKAAVNTRIVGYQISKFIEHLTNTTINDKGPDTSNWGPLHLIGHSLGAHICGVTAKELKKRNNKWLVQRITGLDPAQPCFRNTDRSIHLDAKDAPFVDVIHTNGRHLLNLGSIDFYLNGGKTQPGCKKDKSLNIISYLTIPVDVIEQATCSHGRSYEYFTESLMIANTCNCTFWGYPWDWTSKNISNIIVNPCNHDTCAEMGIRAELYNKRGTFYVATASSSPFCINNTDALEEVKKQLEQDYYDETEN
ncbi:pancreatic triacylglycerol lipase isoform X2 [Harpegnathos saltator]|uniref:pancreatic triacylglycerol lipase isoform X2 n=1 Tax=Harpegnathos saltator TaxID=610380 RepID=UPI00058C17F2|nr:pancreatic triacylglycerol lipase isoform X2 [Harpegnathos saltator]